MTDWIGAVATSFAFLTRLPVPAAHAAMDLKVAMAAFPIAGVVAGAACGLLVALLFAAGVPALPAALVAMAGLALITGGLHEDGLADMADGLGGGGTRERKLAIMRDSRIGTYGVLALVFCVGLRVSAVAQIAPAGSLAPIAALAASAAFSRAMMVWLLNATPAARPDGLGALAGKPSDKTMFTALGIGAALALALLWPVAGIGAALGTIAVAAAVSLAVRALAMRQIGGQTGDVCGAVQMLSESAMLIVICSTLP